MRQATEQFPKPVVIEALEKRQMLSANVGLAFAGKVPGSLPPTGSTRVALRVTDTGTTRINGPVTIQLYGSADTTLDGSDIPLTSTVKMLHLKPRQGANETLTVVSPAPLSNGSYFLIAQVDDSPAMAVSAKPVQYVNPFSDVAVQFANLPATPVEIDGPSAGRRSVTVDVVNTGNIPVRGPVNLNFYLSNDATLDATDPLLAAVLTKRLSLKPGQHKAVSFRVGVPADTATGGYFLFATLSPAAVLNDSNVANNTAMSSSRLAVVNRLPLPPQNHHHDDGYGYGASFDGPVGYVGDDGGYDYSTDDGSDSSSASGDDGSGASSAPVDTGNSGQSDSTPTNDGSGSSDSTPTDNGSSDSAPTDGGSSDSSSDNSTNSDNWDDGGFASSGGDF